MSSGLVKKYISSLKYIIKEAYRLLLREPVTELLGGDARQPVGKVDLPSAAFLRSGEYQRMMDAYVPYQCDPGRNEASTYTKSYYYRHHTCFLRLGVWRWRGMQRKATQLLSLFEQADGRIIDLGGAGCPVGMEAVVVDRLSVDKAGRKVRFSSLKNVEFEPALIFASHVLEHIEDLDGILSEIKAKLADGGWFVVFVPSFTNEGWRAGLHTNARFGAHLWTFGLSSQVKPDGLAHYVNIDILLARFFRVVEAEDVGDDSLFILCQKA